MDSPAVIEFPEHGSHEHCGDIEIGHQHHGEDSAYQGYQDGRPVRPDGTGDALHQRVEKPDLAQDSAQRQRQNRGADRVHHGGNAALAEHRVHQFHSTVDLHSVKHNRQHVGQSGFLYQNRQGEPGKSGDQDRQNSRNLPGC